MNGESHSAQAALALRAAREGRWDGALAGVRSVDPATLDPAIRGELRELLIADGRPAEALALAAPVPESQRGDAGDWMVAALAAHLAGRFDEAAGCARRACELDPASAPALNHLGRALHNAGRTREALQAFERAVALQPGFAPGWHSLGVAQRAGGRLEAAVGCFERALLQRPGYRGAALNLGKTLLALERPAPALAAFEGWLARDPGDADAGVHAGLCLHQLGRIEQARARYEAALATDPGHALGWLYLGILLNQLHASATAEQALLQATRLAPGDPEAWAELTGFYEVESRLEDMQRALQRGLAVAPGDPRLRLEAAILARRQGEFPRALEGMRNVAPDGLPLRIAMRYHYEMGQLLDRIDDADGAMQAYGRANALARAGAHAVGSEAADLRERYAQITSWARRAPAARWPVSPETAERPIFLLGFPRSGTTLLRSMLGAHPALATLEERPTLESCIAALDAGSPGYPWALDQLDDEAAERLRQRHREAVAGFGGGADLDRVVDTHPYRSPHLGLIRRLFPRARVLFLARHPCDVVLSCYMQPFAANAANWHFHTLADSVDYYTRFMDCWQALVEQLPGPPTVLRYEDLVAEPELRMRAMLDALDIDWHPDVLRHHELGQRSGRVTTSSYQQVTQAVHQGARDRWQRYRQHLAPWLPRLAPYAERYGYSLAAPP